MNERAGPLDLMVIQPTPLGAVSGRVEHVHSGKSAHFTSQEELI